MNISYARYAIDQSHNRTPASSVRARYKYQYSTSHIIYRTRTYHISHITTYHSHTVISPYSQSQYACPDMTGYRGADPRLGSHSICKTHLVPIIFHFSHLSI